MANNEETPEVTKASVTVRNEPTDTVDVTVINEEKVAESVAEEVAAAVADEVSEAEELAAEAEATVVEEEVAAEAEADSKVYVEKTPTGLEETTTRSDDVPLFKGIAKARWFKPVVIGIGAVAVAAVAVFALSATGVIWGETEPKKVVDNSQIRDIDYDAVSTVNDVRESGDLELCDEVEEAVIQGVEGAWCKVGEFNEFVPKQ